MQKHKWYNEIVAWASGADIEQRCHSPSIKEVIWSNWEQFDGEWTDEKHWEYRIKPQQQQSSCCQCQQTSSALKEPQYLYVFINKRDGATVVRTFKMANGNETYIGKIKLETDDE